MAVLGGRPPPTLPRGRPLMPERRIICADCGTTLADRVQDETPCPSCGSRRRSVTVLTGAAAQTHASVTATAQTVHAVGIPSAEQFGNPTVTVEDAPVLSITGHPAAHVAIVILSPPSEEGGNFLAEVRGPDGELRRLGVGDDVADALLDLVFALLPPDHPLSDGPDHD